MKLKDFKKDYEDIIPEVMLKAIGDFQRGRIHKVVHEECVAMQKAFLDGNYYFLLPVDIQDELKDKNTGEIAFVSKEQFEIFHKSTKESEKLQS